MLTQLIFVGVCFALTSAQSTIDDDTTDHLIDLQADIKQMIHVVRRMNTSKLSVVFISIFICLFCCIDLSTFAAS